MDLEKRTQITASFIALGGLSEGSQRVTVRALRDKARVSTADAAEFLRSTDDIRDYAEPLRSEEENVTLIEHALTDVRVKERRDARAELLPQIEAARASESLALEEIANLAKERDELRAELERTRAQLLADAQQVLTEVRRALRA